ncbi:hypothetical protein [Nitratireductor aquibiodomus]|nr:hypothetical protein [Nitratireductor aquibiodomus]
MLHWRGAWFDKLTMRDGSGCNTFSVFVNRLAGYHIPHGELVEPRTTLLP